MIKAKIITNDCNIKVSFDAIEWLRQATYGDLFNLVSKNKCEVDRFNQAYFVTESGKYFENNPDLNNVFEYLAFIKNEPNSNCGVKVYINAIDLLNWLKENNQKLYDSIAKCIKELEKKNTMTWNEAKEIFLKEHQPGVADIYICRPGLGGCCSGKLKGWTPPKNATVLPEFNPDDFEIHRYVK